jgi:hypothetical protein
MKHVCEYCQSPIIDKNKKRNRFCNKSCSNAWQHASGKRRDYLNDKSTMEWWIEKYGLEEALSKKQDWKQSVSAATSGDKNPMFGKTYQIHGLVAENNRRKGKKNIEIYGKEKAEIISKKLSEKCKGSKNPAYGKIYENCGISRCQGTYKGVRFRSSYEISFLVHLENSGMELNSVISEPFSIEYEIDGISRTYAPDFQIGKLLLEIKPKSLLNLEENRLKAEAATKYCLNKNLDFKVITEEDFKVLAIQDIMALPDINWNKGAKEHLLWQK